jgi:putative solute:sodium symporter small subunit
MIDNSGHEQDETRSDDADGRIATDGGVDTDADVDYLEAEVNLLKPSTPFMRDHLKQVWAGFIAWVILTWGPVTATYLAPEVMTQPIPVLNFPAHYFSVAFLAPTSSLVLAYLYSRSRDKLDEKYGIDHSTAAVESQDDVDADAAATDGGEPR